MSVKQVLRRGEASRVDKDIRRATLRAIDSLVRVVQRSGPTAQGGEAGRP